MNGFIDKLKQGAEQAKGFAGQAAGQAKDIAGDAAAKARQEAKELQLKRELGEAYDDLGRSAFDLWESKEIEHALLESRARRIQNLREELARVEAGEETSSEA